LTGAAPAIVATLVLLDLLAKHVNAGIEGGKHLAGAFLRPQDEALPASGDLSHISITCLPRRGMVSQFDVDFFNRRQVVIQLPGPFIDMLFDPI
jgi:hypothetical protein